jgi:hypothetical protein
VSIKILKTDKMIGKEISMKTSVWRKQDIATTILCVVFIVVTVHAMAPNQQELVNRMRCATNLKGLGKAMLIYSNDYEDELPKAGGRRNQWVSSIPNWLAATRRKAFGLARDFEGRTTISSSLYLLVKYAEVKMGRFVCPSDTDTREFKLSTVPDKLPKTFKSFDAWDFGGYYDLQNNPSRHCSYAYHVPFGPYSLSRAHEPEMAVLADRNPWMDSKRVSDPGSGWEVFKSGPSNAAEPNAKHLGNSDTHQRDGQNVLFMDSHVNFKTQPNCGVDIDNIYTIATDKTEAGKNIGRMPTLYKAENPLNRRDSVLVQDGAPDATKD